MPEETRDLNESQPESTDLVVLAQLYLTVLGRLSTQLIESGQRWLSDPLRPRPQGRPETEI